MQPYNCYVWWIDNGRKGTTEEIFYNPQHPYTVGLMKSIPKIGDKENKGG